MEIRKGPQEVRREKRFVSKNIYKNMDKPAAHGPVGFFKDEPKQSEDQKIKRQAV